MGDIESVRIIKLLHQAVWEGKVDFEKAFDRIECSFLFSTLQKLNFGPKFIQWIQILYSEPRAMMKKNGFLSNQVTIAREIRQRNVQYMFYFLYL